MSNYVLLFLKENLHSLTFFLKPCIVNILIFIPKPFFDLVKIVITVISVCSQSQIDLFLSLSFLPA